MHVCQEHDGEDIAYEGGLNANCPACTELITLQDRITDLENEVDGLENELSDLRLEIRVNDADHRTD